MAFVCHAIKKYKLDEYRISDYNKLCVNVHTFWEISLIERMGTY